MKFKEYKLTVIPSFKKLNRTIYYLDDMEIGDTKLYSPKKKDSIVDKVMIYNKRHPEKHFISRKFIFKNKEYYAIHREK